MPGGWAQLWQREDEGVAGRAGVRAAAHLGTMHVAIANTLHEARYLQGHDNLHRSEVNQCGLHVAASVSNRGAELFGVSANNIWRIHLRGKGERERQRETEACGTFGRPLTVYSCSRRIKSMASDIRLPLLLKFALLRKNLPIVFSGSLQY